MSVLLIDNNDSFTYNLVEMMRTKCNVSCSVVYSAELSISDLEGFSNVLISPGPMTPMDYPILNKVIEYCYHKSKPLLGVCLGHQAIGVHFGGELTRLPKVVHGVQETISIDNTSPIYTTLAQKIDVGLYHSWAINPYSLPHSLIATGYSADGRLMSFGHISRPIFGIQFHPESFMTKQGEVIMRNFLNL